MGAGDVFSFEPELLLALNVDLPQGHKIANVRPFYCWLIHKSGNVGSREKIMQRVRRLTLMALLFCCWEQFCRGRCRANKIPRKTRRNRTVSWNRCAAV
jgi:hypothetical protein